MHDSAHSATTYTHSRPGGSCILFGPNHAIRGATLGVRGTPLVLAALPPISRGAWVLAPTVLRRRSPPERSSSGVACVWLRPLAPAFAPLRLGEGWGFALAVLPLRPCDGSGPGPLGLSGSQDTKWGVRTHGCAASRARESGITAYLLFNTPLAVRFLPAASPQHFIPACPPPLLRCVPRSFSERPRAALQARMSH